jgi:para-nitrobenzyl esterase
MCRGEHVTVVEAREGKLEGEAQPGLLVFRGIPFARPPEGGLRWRTPEPPAKWSGVRAARRFGAQSWQRPFTTGPIASLMSTAVANGEDCLTLNIWTPAADDRGRAVMVWIHGGGFTIGGGAQPIYDGTALARCADVVVVTINYRLGALGFLRLVDVSNGRIPATGNEGLLDQVRALEWVRDNIVRFGGDPGNVTIFGESAGGMSVGALLAMPKARGLFRRAIAQSGACSTANPSARSSEIADGFLKHLKLDAAALPDIDPERITRAAEAYQVAAGGIAGGMLFQPCIEPPAMPALPIDAVKKGSADGVSVMVGACADEWLLLDAMNPNAAALEEDELKVRLNKRVGARSTALIDGYRSMLAVRGAPIDTASVASAIETDRIYRMPALRLADALAARGNPAYHYEFTWRSPMLNGRLKACHAIDIAFVFATHGINEGVASFSGAGASADALAATVQDAWASFARTGQPSTPALDGWRPYTDANLETALLDSPAALVQRRLREERRLWEGHADGDPLGRL